MSEEDVAEVAGRKEAMYSRTIAKTPEIIQRLWARNDYRRIASNVKVLSQSAVCLAMLVSRIHGNNRKALQILREPLSAVDELAKVAGKERVSAAPFELPIYWCLLAGNLDKARELSDAALGMSLRDSGNYFELSSRLLASFVVNDGDRFGSTFDVYQSVQKVHRQVVLASYADIYRAVLNGDHAGYTALMRCAADRFPERATDTKFGEGVPEFGGLRENAYALDFMSLGIAVVAHAGGMETDVDTEFFPKELYSAIVG